MVNICFEQMQASTLLRFYDTCELIMLEETPEIQSSVTFPPILNYESNSTIDWLKLLYSLFIKITKIISTYTFLKVKL